MTAVYHAIFDYANAPNTWTQGTKIWKTQYDWSLFGDYVEAAVIIILHKT